MPKITELISFEGTLSNSDVFPVVNSSVTKKMPMSALRANVLTSGAISSTMLQVDSVTTTKIANGNVTEVKLADGAVTNAKLANQAVNAAKIADLTITGGKLVNATITDVQLAANAVTTGKIADLNVTTAKIANGAVSFDKLTALSPANVLMGNSSSVPTATAISGDGSLSASGVLTVNNISNGSITTAKIVSGAVNEDKLAANAVTTAKIADANVTDAKLNTTGVTANSYGAAATIASVTIPFFTVSSKGRITAAGAAAFPGERVVNRVIYNDHITPSGVTSFDANPSLITLPGTYPLNQVGNARNVIGINYLDIFGGQLQAYTTQVSGSRVHFHFRFQATLYNGHAILSTRFKINNTIIAKIPVSVNGWPEFPVTWEYWYPVTSAGTVLNLLFEGRCFSTSNMMRVHYAKYWEGNDIANGTPNPPGYVYISPQIVITEWV